MFTSTALAATLALIAAVPKPLSDYGQLVVVVADERDSQDAELRRYDRGLFWMRIGDAHRVGLDGGATGAFPLLGEATLEGLGVRLDAEASQDLAMWLRSWDAAVVILPRDVYLAEESAWDLPGRAWNVASARWTALFWLLAAAALLASYGWTYRAQRLLRRALAAEVERRQRVGMVATKVTVDGQGWVRIGSFDDDPRYIHATANLVSAAFALRVGEHRLEIPAGRDLVFVDVVGDHKRVDQGEATSLDTAHLTVELRAGTTLWANIAAAGGTPRLDLDDPTRASEAAEIEMGSDADSLTLRAPMPLQPRWTALTAWLLAATASIVGCGLDSSMLPSWGVTTLCLFAMFLTALFSGELVFAIATVEPRGGRTRLRFFGIGYGFGAGPG